MLIDKTTTIITTTLTTTIITIVIIISNNNDQGMIWLPAFFPHVAGVVVTVKMAKAYPQYQVHPNLIITNVRFITWRFMISTCIQSRDPQCLFWKNPKYIIELYCPV